LECNLAIWQVLRDLERGGTDPFARTIQRTEMRIVWVVRTTIGFIASVFGIAGRVERRPIVGFFKGDHSETDEASGMVESFPLNREGVAAAGGVDRVVGVL
jgi:hypothetical protein